MNTTRTRACPNCGGAEYSIEGGPCPACKGTGKVPDRRVDPMHDRLAAEGEERRARDERRLGVAS